MNKETLTLTDAAEYLNTSPETVESLISCAEIPAGKIGKAYVLHIDDLRDYLRREIARQTAERAELARKVASGDMPRTERPAVMTAGGEARARRRKEPPSLRVAAQ